MEIAALKNPSSMSSISPTLQDIGNHEMHETHENIAFEIVCVGKVATLVVIDVFV